MEFQRKILLLSKHNLQLLLAKVIFHQYLGILSLSVCNFMFSLFLCFLSFQSVWKNFQLKSFYFIMSFFDWILL